VSFEVAKALAQARSFGLCEGCGVSAPLDPHHRMTRGSGGVHGAAAAVSNDVRNLLMLCRPCHDFTLSQAAFCIEVGWVIERRAGVDPRDVPAHIYTVNGRGWWYLTGDGGYRWADELNLHENYRITYDVPRCQNPACPDYGDPDFGEGTCPAEHADKIENNEEENTA
jgi:hypothetical protein